LDEVFNILLIDIRKLGGWVVRWHFLLFARLAFCCGFECLAMC